MAQLQYRHCTVEAYNVDNTKMQMILIINQIRVKALLMQCAGPNNYKKGVPQQYLQILIYGNNRTIIKET